MSSMENPEQSEGVPFRKFVHALTLLASTHGLSGDSRPMKFEQPRFDTSYGDVLDRSRFEALTAEEERLRVGVVVVGGASGRKQARWPLVRVGDAGGVEFDVGDVQSVLENIDVPPHAVCVVHNHLALATKLLTVAPSVPDLKLATSISSVRVQGRDIPVVYSVTDPLFVWNYRALTEEEKKARPDAGAMQKETAEREAEQQYFFWSRWGEVNGPASLEGEPEAYRALREAYANMGVYLEAKTLEEAKKEGPCGLK